MHRPVPCRFIPLCLGVVAGIPARVVFVCNSPFCNTSTNTFTLILFWTFCNRVEVERNVMHPTAATGFNLNLRCTTLFTYLLVHATIAVIKHCRRRFKHSRSQSCATHHASLVMHATYPKAASTITIGTMTPMYMAPALQGTTCTGKQMRKRLQNSFKTNLFEEHLQHLARVAY